MLKLFPQVGDLPFVLWMSRWFFMFLIQLLCLSFFWTGTGPLLALFAFASSGGIFCGMMLFVIVGAGQHKGGGVWGWRTEI